MHILASIDSQTWGVLTGSFENHIFFLTPHITYNSTRRLHHLKCFQYTLVRIDMAIMMPKISAALL